MHISRFAALVVSLLAPAALAQLSVTSISPIRNSIGAPRSSAISVTFNTPVNTATVTPGSFWAYGRNSGPVSGAFSFSNSNQTVTLTPSHDLSAGEVVMVILSHDLRAASGASLRAAGYSYVFWVGATPSGGALRKVHVLSDRLTPSDFPRIYGGMGADVNNDRFNDIVVINEVAGDIRTFLSNAGSSFNFAPFLTPSLNQPCSSPHFPSDFNRDGIPDLCTSNCDTDNVSVLFGLGNGRYTLAQNITVGDGPAGIAVLDADGDGDIDIAAANASSNNLCLMLNNGSGVFGAPAFFDGGVFREWGLYAADMNNDGILDLVTGGENSNDVSILLGNGNATFSQFSLRGVGAGPIWMVQCGDLNGDGKLDVATSNSFSNTGGVLLGDGLGHLGAATLYSSDAHIPSGRLADMDGDNDLDFVMSSYGASRWIMYKNNGAGAFTRTWNYDAINRPACSASSDLDNDGDMDLLLFDELDCTITVMRNVCPADVDNGAGGGIPDEGVDVNDLLFFLARFEAGNSIVDLDNGSMTGIQDGGVDINDLLYFLAHFESGC